MKVRTAMKTMTIRLPSEKVEELERLAAESGDNVSAIVRRGVYDEMDLVRERIAAKKKQTA